MQYATSPLSPPSSCCGTSNSVGSPLQQNELQNHCVVCLETAYIGFSGGNCAARSRVLVQVAAPTSHSTSVCRHSSSNSSTNLESHRCGWITLYCTKLSGHHAPNIDIQEHTVSFLGIIVKYIYTWLLNKVHEAVCIAESIRKNSSLSQRNSQPKQERHYQTATEKDAMLGRIWAVAFTCYIHEKYHFKGSQSG